MDTFLLLQLAFLSIVAAATTSFGRLDVVLFRHLWRECRAHNYGRRKWWKYASTLDCRGHNNYPWFGHSSSSLLFGIALFLRVLWFQNAKVVVSEWQLIFWVWTRFHNLDMVSLQVTLTSRILYTSSFWPLVESLYGYSQSKWLRRYANSQQRENGKNNRSMRLFSAFFGHL